jgi:hypothetical protein
MENLHQIETIILLLTVVLALTTLAHKLLIPYPILLVVGGLILGLIPGLPIFHLDPDLVFLIFLPLILWAAAYFTSLREFRSAYKTIWRSLKLRCSGLIDLASSSAILCDTTVGSWRFCMVPDQPPGMQSCSLGLKWGSLSSHLGEITCKALLLDQSNDLHKGNDALHRSGDAVYGCCYTSAGSLRLKHSPFLKLLQKRHASCNSAYRYCLGG